MKVYEVMTPRPLTAPAEATLSEVWEIMRQHDVRHVPIVERGKLVGIVSERDIAALDPTRVLTAEGAEAIRRHLDTPAVRLMSSNVIAVDPETDVDEAIDLMLEGKVGALPVVSLDAQEVVGIVSYVDLLRAARDLLAQE